MKNQSGFTLIELVLVIIVLGILSATAMPRFANLSDDAKSATYKSISSSLQASVSLVHSKWLIDGQQIPVGKPINGYHVGDVYINKYGYPRLAHEVGQKCAGLFAKLLPGSEAISEENIESTASPSGGDGNGCTYNFEKISENSYLYSIMYDEVTGKVEFTVKS